MESTSKPSASVQSVLVTDLSFPVSDLNINGVELAFLKKCRSHVDNPTALEFGKPPKFDLSRLTKNYADAFTDTHGLFSGAPFVFKTGAARPKATGGPNAHPFRRELRPIGDHPMRV
jgi:hypothetical protein